MNAEPIFSVRGLIKHFGGLCATDNLSLDIERGELHALIGPNGAGKSTAIAQCSGELKPDAGHFIFDGKDVSHASTEQRARLGLVRSYQLNSLFDDLPVLQNVMLAVQARSASHLRFFYPAAKDRSLIDPAKKILIEAGLSSRLNDPAMSLSHGEKRQLELAMVLATEPKILMLDEPLAGMGLEDSRRMIELIRGLKKRYTILLVEHDMHAVFELADRISVLVYGRIIATGSPAEIRDNADVRAAYLGQS